MNYYRMNPRLKKSGGGNKTMTVILDLTNPDPTQWATYADDAVGMVAGSDAWDEFFGHYPCILENGVELGKLKTSDFGQYEDGTTAPITTLGKDVMICFPRRGLKISKNTTDNTLTISMTNEEGKTGYNTNAFNYKSNPINKFYLGAYKGYVSSNNLYSTSGQSPTSGIKIGNIRTYARARGTGYEQANFYQTVYRQAMYLLKYKGQNAQIAIGRGYVDGNSTKHATGGTNARGMDWGESTGKDQMKLFGIEDFYGNIMEYIDGIYADGSRRIKVDTTNGNYNDTGTNYSTQVSAISDTVLGYIKNISTSSGFLQIKPDDYGSETTYFCDTCAIVAYRCGTLGGYYSSGDNAGVFSNGLNADPDSPSAYTGSRLTYMPTT